MDRLPAAVLAVLVRLEALPARSQQELGDSLDRFERALAAGAHHPFADARLAGRMAAGCRQLLGSDDNHTPERLRRVQVAIDYLALAEDAEPDRDSLLGFDDDAEVFDAIARSLGREDLTVGDQRS